MNEQLRHVRGAVSPAEPALLNLPDSLVAGVPVAPTTSRAAIASVLGALVLLFALTRPMVQPDFAADSLLPALLPRALVGAPSEPQPRTTLDDIGLEPQPAELAGAGAGRELLESLRTRHGEQGLSLSALGAAMLDAHALVATQPAPSRGHLVALRTGTAALALVALFAALSALWGLARRLAAPDRLQLAAQLGFGATLSVAFGLAALAALFDPIVATQLRPEACLIAFVGAALLFVAAIARLRAREALPVVALALAMLAGSAGFIALGATI